MRDEKDIVSNQLPLSNQYQADYSNQTSGRSPSKDLGSREASQAPFVTKQQFTTGENTVDAVENHVIMNGDIHNPEDGEKTQEKPYHSSIPYTASASVEDSTNINHKSVDNQLATGREIHIDESFEEMVQKENSTILQERKLDDEVNVINYTNEDDDLVQIDKDVSITRNIENIADQQIKEMGSHEEQSFKHTQNSIININSHEGQSNRMQSTIDQI